MKVVSCSSVSIETLIFWTLTTSSQQLDASGRFTPCPQIPRAQPGTVLPALCPDVSAYPSPGVSPLTPILLFLCPNISASPCLHMPVSPCLIIPVSHNSLCPHIFVLAMSHHLRVPASPHLFILAYRCPRVSSSPRPCISVSPASHRPHVPMSPCLHVPCLLLLLCGLLARGILQELRVHLVCRELHVADDRTSDKAVLH